MIPYLAILIPAFMGLKAFSMPPPLALDFFGVPGCGKTPDGTSNTSSVAIYNPNMVDPVVVQCDNNCTDAKVENDIYDIKSVAFNRNDTEWDYHYGCLLWDKANNQDCTNVTRAVFVEPQDECIDFTIPKGDGIWIMCHGLPMGDEVPCPGVKAYAWWPSTTASHYQWDFQCVWCC